MGEEGDSNMANANAKATANANSNTNVNAANALLPSQTITSKPRQRNRRKRKPKSANNPNNADVESDNAGSTHNNTSTNETKMKPKPDTTRTTRTRTRKKKDSKKVEGNAKPDPNTDPNSNQNNDNKTASKAKKKAKPKKRNKKKFSWRKEVPPNTVDPISLEPLVSLPYPPFALTITPPYDIIPDWPIPVPVNGTNANTSSDSAKATSGTNKDSKQNGNGKKGFQKTNGAFDSAQCEIETKKRQDLLIQKQWGDALPKLKNSELSPILGQNGGGEDSGSEVKANTALETKQHDETKESDVEEDTIFDADADADADANIEKEMIVKEEKQHFHLFDGRVLAVYLVSTLQFIDPLNRRDLTRDEVKNLDAYLAKHHLKKMRVLEAYDDKGVSMSTAGASAQTPSGRLRMRQEQASNLLASLFQDNVGVSSQQQQSQLQSRRTNNRSGTRNRQNGDRDGNNISDDNSNTYRGNTISNQYASYEMNHQLQQQAYDYGSENANANDGSQYGFGYGYGSQWNFDEGGYADNEGMLIIDDDVNPGLRGGVSQSYNPNTNNSAHVVDWHGHRAQGGESFPSLPSAGPRTSTGTESTTNPEQQASSTQQQKKPKPISKSLSKIGNVVHKTSKKQLEKQRKARELAMRKAELASMPFEEAVKRSLLGDDGSTPSQMPTLRQPIRPLGHVEPTEGQLERNLKFSTALDVKPSTMRGCLNSGWTRPTSSFRDELNEINYPDELIIEARERMTELLRFEKKIITFLKNDKAASIPLKPMDRPLRKFIHHYSDFWNLHTESFDPAPNRYIHCVKLLETRAPQTLLSTAVRTWRGPTPAPLPPTAQSAGEDTMSTAREFIQTEERAPLKLEPRSASNVVPPPGAMFDLQLDIAGIDIAATSNDKNLLSSLSREPAARFAPMLAERERPVLKLDARTKPLELPQYQPQSTLSVNTAEMSVNYKMRLNVNSDRKRKDLEKKKKIVAAAFCSDSDDEDDSDSDWEVQEALVTASDNE